MDEAFAGTAFADPMKVGIVAEVINFLNMRIATPYTLMNVQWWAVYFLNALVVTTVVPHFFPDLPSSMAISVVVSMLGFLYSMVLSQQLQSSLTGYEAAIVRFLSTLQRLETLGFLLASTRDPEIAALLIFAVRPLDHIFRQAPPEVELLPTHASHWDLPSSLRKMPFRSPPQLFSQTMAHIVGRLSKERDSVHTEMVAPIIRSLIDDVHEEERATRISPPTNMDSHLTFFVTVWNAIITPLLMWQQLGSAATMAIYPTIMLTVTGPILARKWLGNVWSPTRPQVESTHEAWPTEYMRRINDAFFS